MKKLLSVLLLLWALGAQAQSQPVPYYSYFPPYTVWLPPGTSFTLSNGLSLTNNLSFANTGAPLDSKTTQFGVNATVGNFVIAPVNDAGAVTANNFFQIVRSGNAFNGILYQGGGQTLSYANNDLKVTSAVNTAPLIWVIDPGSSGALAGFRAQAGSNAGNQADGFFTCVGSQWTGGQQLAQGPNNYNCTLSTGNSPFSSGSNSVLSIGTVGAEAVRIETNQNVSLDLGIISANYTGTFTLSAGTGACATTSTLTGGKIAGSFLCTGTAGASTVLVTLPTAPNGWSCWCSDVTSGVAGAQSTTATTSATLKVTIATTSDKVVFGCMGF